MKSSLARFISVALFVILTASLSPSVAEAMLSPVYKECLQRGFVIGNEEGTSDEYCLFPDESRCSLKDLNSDLCDNPYTTQDYCVKKGNPVWDEGKCCEGLAPHFPKGMEGQMMCQSIQSSLENPISSLLKGVPLVSPLVFLLVLFLFIGILLVFLFEKKRK